MSMEPTEYTSFHWYSFLFFLFLENKSNEFYKSKKFVT